MNEPSPYLIVVRSLVALGCALLWNAFLLGVAYWMPRTGVAAASLHIAIGSLMALSLAATLSVGWRKRIAEELANRRAEAATSSSGWNNTPNNATPARSRPEERRRCQSLHSLRMPSTRS